jgi:hypothetical protein
MTKAVILALSAATLVDSVAITWEADIEEVAD